MSARRPSPRAASPSSCRQAREWVTLGLGTAAGGAFIWRCLQGPAPFWPCTLLLFLCLTLLGRRTALDRLTAILRVLKRSP